MMTDQQFDEQLAKINAAFGAAEACRDQELARLFHDCGWTQERIAQKVGKKQQWVSYRLLFARFLDYNHGCKTQIPGETLTERRFRASWGKTKGKEPERFRQVVQLLNEDVPPGYLNQLHKPGIRPAIINLCRDGQRRTRKEVAAALDEILPGITAKQVTQALNDLQKKPPKGYAV
jgi:hypothetical protein